MNPEEKRKMMKVVIIMMKMSNIKICDLLEGNELLKKEITEKILNDERRRQAGLDL